MSSLLTEISRRALEDLLAPIRPSIYAGGSLVLLRWCPTCIQWMREGSAAAGRCVDCGHPRPAQLSCPSIHAPNAIPTATSAGSTKTKKAS